MKKVPFFDFFSILTCVCQKFVVILQSNLKKRYSPPVLEQELNGILCGKIKRLLSAALIPYIISN